MLPGTTAHGGCTRVRHGHRRAGRRVTRLANNDDAADIKTAATAAPSTVAVLWIPESAGPPQCFDLGSVTF